MEMQQIPILQGRLTAEQVEALDPTTRDKAVAHSKLVLERMSPPNALGLPPVLEARRWEVGIADHYFKQTATFEKILLYKVEDDGGATFGGGLIAKPDDVRAREAQEAPRGIIISAGLGALDVMRSNGIGLGDLVTFTRGAVTRIRVGYVGGLQEWATVIYADDISASLDLADRLKSGEVTLERGESGKHFYKWNGEALPVNTVPDQHPNT